MLNMKKHIQLILFLFLALISGSVSAQVALGTGTTYTENFDGIGTALPTGFTTYFAGTTTSLGTTAVLTTAATAWNNTSGAFKNFASANGTGLTGASSVTDQAAATNRALGLRPTGTVGDGGGSFVFQATNTTGKKSLKLSFALQSLDQTVTRTQGWSVEYGIGASPTTFTPITATGNLTTGGTTAPSPWGSNTITVDFGTALDNVSDVVTIRIIDAVSAGAGSRASTGIDDFTLTWTNVTAGPTLTANPTSLDFGTNQTVNSASAAKSFVLSGTGVTAATTLNVTGPYTISATSGGTYGTSLSIAAIDLANSPSVFVKFTPTAAGALPGSIAIASGTGSTSVSLTGSGVAIANPSVLTVTPATLTFSSQVINTSSASQFFNFTATNLSDVVTATASGPYLVSKDGIAFSDVVSYTTTEAALGPKVYVQFTPTAVGAAAASTITIATSTAVASKTVALTGTGAAVPAPPAGTASHVVISEMYGGGGNGGAVYTYDFIELYNPTSAPVDISGWSVVYASATSLATAPFTASATTQTVIPANSTIKAHGYFLIQEAPGTTVTNIPLPVTADLVGGITIGAAAGKVALLNTATVPTTTASTGPTIVDFMGFGATATTYEGTGPTVAPSNSTSVERKASATSTAATMAAGGTEDLQGNGYDSDNNANDFFVPTVVNPQNSASTVEPTLTPAYAATPTPLTFSQNVNTTSAGVAVALAGSGTLPATSVGTSGPYLISKTATGGYTNVLTFTATEMAATTKPVVYVQFTPTALGTANSNLFITGVGATQQIIPLNGTGTAQPVPTLTTTPSTLTFSSFVNTAAPVQNYTLSGTNITTVTTVSATAPYLVSKDGITFTASISFAITELNAAQTPKVYVQFKPTAVGVGGVNNGVAAQTTNGGATVTANVTLNGTGIAAPNVAPTLDVIADQSVCSVTTTLSIGLTGITVGPSSETASQAIKLFTVTSSNPSLFASLGVTPIIGTTSTINYAIANGQTGTAIVTVTLKDNGGILNGGVDSLKRTFNVTVNALAQVTITSDALNNIVEKGGVATLTATGGASYSWTANTNITSGLGSASITIRPTATATYTVAATNASGCVTTQTISITIRNAAKLETGNVLTPNGDGKNDYWVIRNIDLYSGNTVKVFDKAGKLVFTKTGYNNDWNGYYNGSPLPQGTYYYVVDLGVGLPYKGTLSVVRD
jgi:gliding motility-associated-like protein